MPITNFAANKSAPISSSTNMPHYLNLNSSKNNSSVLTPENSNINNPKSNKLENKASNAPVFSNKNLASLNTLNDNNTSFFSILPIILAIVIVLLIILIIIYYLYKRNTSKHDYYDDGYEDETNAVYIS
jgi:hypothetical protein